LIHPQPVLETSRLLLRELTLDDVDGLLELFGDPEAMWAYPSTKDRAETERWIERSIRSYRVNGWGLWAVIRRDDGRFLGDCGMLLQPVDGAEVAELGYHIVRSEWRRGYATEAALACRDWYFANPANDRLVSIIWPPNTASRRVAERVHARMRLFVWEKTGTEECLYETLRSDLTAARPEAFQRRCRGGTKVKEFTQSRASKPLDSGAFGPKVDIAAMQPRLPQRQGHG